MPDPEIFDRILQTCSFRFRNIVCPNKEKFANIAAAKLQIWGCGLVGDRVFATAERQSEVRDDLPAARFGRRKLKPVFRDAPGPALVGRCPWRHRNFPQAAQIQFPGSEIG
jgi:hypothetical protein